jgi:hypothetical protein
MAVTDLILKQIDEKFAEMLKDIHDMNVKGIKCGIQINLSGNPLNFNYKFLSIDPVDMSKLCRRRGEYIQGK